MKPYLKPGELEIESPENTVREIYRNLMLNSYFRNLGMDKRTVAGGAVLGVALAALILSSGCVTDISSNTDNTVIRQKIDDYGFVRVIYCYDRLICYEEDVYAGYAISCPDRPDLAEKYCGPLQNQTGNKTK